jgi:hypothetical protein
LGGWNNGRKFIFLNKSNNYTQKKLNQHKKNPSNFFRRGFNPATAVTFQDLFEVI